MTDTAAAPARSRAVGGAGPALAVSGLRKRYPSGRQDVVGGLSFEVAHGEVFGLLGPNGAGKTTTIGILTTRARPTAGSVRLAGIDVLAEPGRARNALAVVPQRNNLDRSLSVRQNLLFHASYHGVPRREREARAERLLRQFGLADRADDTPDAFSGGQAQRVMIARALMHAPTVLFLDEPSTGLDPAARLFVWDRIRELRADGTSVVITTHDMHEAAELCDRVGIMDQGVLLASGAPAELIGALPGERTLDLEVGAEGAVIDECVRRLQELGPVVGVERVAAAPARGGRPGGGGWGSGGGARAGGAPSVGAPAGRSVRLRLSIEGEVAAVVGPVAVAVASAGTVLTGIAVSEPNLEDVFIHHTGRALR